MTRIRYNEANGVLTSKPILAGTDLVYVEINTTENAYTIKRTSDLTTLSQGSAVDVNTLKKKAKLAMKALGAVFNDEVRRKEA
ncbi:MAG: hypothetical protein EB116_03480 [Betaproteobacteria bacterium]|nr:hypothetical protein [Betaproteobacteria bacterium]